MPQKKNSLFSKEPQNKQQKKRPFSTAASLFVGGIWKIPKISRKKLLEQKKQAAQKKSLPTNQTRKTLIAE